MEFNNRLLNSLMSVLTITILLEVCYLGVLILDYDLSLGVAIGNMNELDYTKDRITWFLLRVNIFPVAVTILYFIVVLVGLVKRKRTFELLSTIAILSIAIVLLRIFNVYPIVNYWIISAGKIWTLFFLLFFFIVFIGLVILSRNKIYR